MILYNIYEDTCTNNLNSFNPLLDFKSNKYLRLPSKACPTGFRDYEREHIVWYKFAPSPI